MRIADEFTLICRTPGDADTVPVSDIHRHGIATGKSVPGALLEAAVRWRDFTLLFTTDDVPYEEMLRILLLDAQLDRVDSALIGAPYSTGTFSGLRLLAPDTVGFRFIGDFDWTVELRPARQWRVPWFSEPAGVWRRFGCFRHFVVRAHP